MSSLGALISDVDQEDKLEKAHKLCTPWLGEQIRQKQPSLFVIYRTAAAMLNPAGK